MKSSLFAVLKRFWSMSPQSRRLCDASSDPIERAPAETHLLLCILWDYNRSRGGGCFWAVPDAILCWSRFSAKLPYPQSAPPVRGSMIILSVFSVCRQRRHTNKWLVQMTPPPFLRIFKLTIFPDRSSKSPKSTVFKRLKTFLASIKLAKSTKTMSFFEKVIFLFILVTKRHYSFLRTKNTFLENSVSRLSSGVVTQLFWLK